PIMLRWPAKLKPKRDDSSLVSSIDLAPTILAACGIERPREMKGIDMLRIGTDDPTGRYTAFGEIYEHDVVDLDNPERGLLFRWCIDGHWKLILPKDGKNPELYDLSTDPAEKPNVAAANFSRVSALTKINK